MEVTSSEMAFNQRGHLKDHQPIASNQAWNKQTEIDTVSRGSVYGCKTITAPYTMHAFANAQKFEIVR